MREARAIVVKERATTRSMFLARMSIPNKPNSVHPVDDGCTHQCQIGAPRSRYLVFTSAGDNSSLRHWLRGRRNFDIWITYYGDGAPDLNRVADHFNRRKGGKFPNLHYAWQHWPEVFEQYEAIFVLDDDIVLSGSEISHLFRILERYELTLLQPAFSPLGQISHEFTAAKLGSFGRYVTLIELGVPLFRRSALQDFLTIYDPKVVGWGVDWWYMHTLRDQGPAAIIDSITCINPDARVFGRPRAIEMLQSNSLRKATWEEVARAQGITTHEEGARELGSISPLAWEDHLSVVTAPLKALLQSVFSPHSRISLQRRYWRMSKRMRSWVDTRDHR